jgi:23S rRNA (guanosine2251-2'-O)-methyltransferase
MKEWLYGRNPVYETLRAARRQPYLLRVQQGVQEKGNLAESLRIAREKKIPVEYVPRQQLDGLDRNHQGVALQVGEYTYSDLQSMLARAEREGRPPFLLLLDTLQDVQNLGTLLRTAEIVGVHGVVLPLARTATITPAVVSASSGASEHMLVGQYNLAQAIDLFIQKDIWVIGLDSGEDAQPAPKVRLDGALALVVGNEGEGMRRLVRDKCDIIMRLPQRGQINSLNAAVAGSIALYLAWAARDYN